MSSIRCSRTGARPCRKRRDKHNTCVSEERDLCRSVLSDRGVCTRFGYCRFFMHPPPVVRVRALIEDLKICIASA